MGRAYSSRLNSQQKGESMGTSLPKFTLDRVGDWSVVCENNSCTWCGPVNQLISLVRGGFNCPRCNKKVLSTTLMDNWQRGDQ
jgi:tRNA(Ile2) C34 agmatinyltransferase TiaS